MTVPLGTMGVHVIMPVCMVMVMTVCVLMAVVMGMIGAVIVVGAMVMAVGGVQMVVVPHRGMGRAALPAVHALVEQGKNLGLEAEVRRMGKAHAGVLPGQMPHLPVDALHERAGEQVVRQHDDLRHAQRHLPLHHALQSGVGDAREGDVHQLVVALLPQPAGHLGHLAVGLAVAGAAPQQHHARAARIGHIEAVHGMPELAPQHGQDRLARSQMRSLVEAHAGMALAGGLDGAWNVALDVPGRVQDERQHQHAAGAGTGCARGAVQPLVEQHIGKLDEADLDVPARMPLAPAGRELFDFVVAARSARAVADQEKSVLHGVRFRNVPWAEQKRQRMPEKLQVRTRQGARRAPQRPEPGMPACSRAGSGA